MPDERLLCSLIAFFTYLHQGLAEICSGPTKTINLAPFKGTWLKYPSGDVGQPYGTFQNCSWLIDAGVGYKVLLNLKESECKDTLIVHGGSRRDSPILPDFTCGNKVSKSADQTVLITFITDNKTNQGEMGFEFRFMAVKNKGNDCSASAVRYATRTVDFITSPDFPVKYSASLSCTWKVQSTEFGNDVEMYFEYRHLALDGISVCEYDLVSIDKQYACGLKLFSTSNKYSTMNESAVVEFKSDDDRVFDDIGFVLAYYIKDLDKCDGKRPEKLVCENGGTCVNSTCACVDGFSGIYCEIISPQIEINFPSMNDSVKVEEGHTLELNCTIVNWHDVINSSLNHSLVWYKDNHEIDLKGPDYDFVNTRDTIKITKNSVVESDEGNYTCHFKGGFSIEVETAMMVKVFRMDKCDKDAPIYDENMVCQNEGFCKNSTCHCRQGYTGQLCERESISVSGVTVDPVIGIQQHPLIIHVNVTDIFQNNVRLLKSGIVEVSSVVYDKRKISDYLWMHTITIPQLHKGDSGEYMILATNNGTIASKQLNLTVLPLLQIIMTPDAFSIPKETGKDLELICTITNLNDIEKFTEEPIITWYKSDRLIEETELVQESGVSKLVKRIESYNDSGVYSCNHTLYPEQKKAKVQLVVIDLCDKTLRPYIECRNGATCVYSSCVCTKGYVGQFCESISIAVNITKKDTDVREGGQISVEVKITDKYNLEYVDWTRNGISISNSERYTISTYNVSPGVYRNTLKINHVLERDKGIWKCTASNGATSSEGNITINVTPSVHLRLDPKLDFAIKRGSELNLNCSVLNPESLIWIEHGSLKWYNGNGEIKNDSEWLIKTTNSTSQLVRRRVELVDEGVYSCNHSGYPESDTIDIKVIVYKPETVSCKNETDRHGLEWNETPSNKRQESLCPQNLKGRASRLCDADGQWKPTNLINCTEPVFVEVSEQLDEVILDGVQDKGTIESTLKNTILTVRNFTEKQNVLSTGDLSSSLSILEKIVTVTEAGQSTVEEKAFFDVVDTILSPNNSVVLNSVSKETTKDTSTVIKTIDRMSEVVIQDNNLTPITHVGQSFELGINRTLVHKSDIIFPKDTALKTKDTHLKLPRQASSKTKETNYVVVIYKTVKDMVPVPPSPAVVKDSKSKSTSNEKSEDYKEFLNSQILSLSTQHDLGELSPPLKLTFRHVEKNASKNVVAVCVSWDFSISKWTEYGCHVNSSTDDVTVCDCNHLTNFAILMKPNTKKSDDSKTLGIISIIGCAVSILFTLLTFVLFAIGWKFIRSDQNVLMMNLCASIVLSYTLFIFGVKATDNQVLCYAVTAALHFLFLVTFFLMLGLGIYYFLLVTVTYYAMHVTNNFKTRSHLQWFLVGAWGIPAALTGGTIGIFWNNGYHMQHFCWLSVNSGSLYFFIIPVLVIAVVNVAIIISLIRVMCATSSMAKSSLNKKAASSLRSLGTLVPVLGVTWIFGIFAIDERTVFFQYIFTIANSLQGFFIFLSHVLLNKKLLAGMKSSFLPSVYGKEKRERVSLQQTASTALSSNSRLRTQNVKRESMLKRLSLFKRKSSPKGEMCAKECSSLMDSKWESDDTHAENVKVNTCTAVKDLEERYVTTTVT